MSVSVLGRASLGVDIVPDWAFWLVVWWAGWFAILLTWYESNKKEPLSGWTCFFMFLMAGFAPILGAIIAVRKGFRNDK